MDGWIKIHRSLRESAIWGNPKLVYFWLWCLMETDIKEHEVIVAGSRIKIKPGQFVFGRKRAAEETGLGEITTYRYLKLLEELHMVKRSVNNHFTVVTIVNWRKYQCKDKTHVTASDTTLDTTLDTVSDTQNKNIYKAEQSDRLEGGSQAPLVPGVRVDDVDWDEIERQGGEGHV